MLDLFYFFKSEDGAVTVDWVVLTGAILGFGLIIVASVGAGATDVSSTLGANLGDAEPPSAVLPVF